ncbi:TetR/AcrR family transcriptional regulator [Mycolicibacterium setense]|uniref:TetR/AcrR family transcriptional regulator n=1 Tax=Mycolicibacterium setense TaxID=431269 RepID=UPI0005745CF1|nr:TetR/AcrR family transcriptional regulator [Mycolicibacterium setense]KHO22102.1 TetR family transcriptional regulator [Mycolicibacterium setense]MCV7113657.1 TetR/AcrR family transcriptional regulator [Mycolicibacterium setense]
MATEQLPPRRDRVRQATLNEIHATARRLLVKDGPRAVTVNAVAREMGMSGPALYRYFPNHEALMQALTADCYMEVTRELAGVRAAHAHASASRRILAMCRALRAWATAHPAEFGLMFTTPANTIGPESLSHDAALSFEAVFRDEIATLWESKPFPVPDLSRLEPSLRKQLDVYSNSIGGQLPPEASHVFLQCWMRLYGLLVMEVFRQVEFVFTDLTPVFEQLLREICQALGLDYAKAGRHR